MPAKLLPPDGSSLFTVVVRKQKQRAGLTQDFTFDYRAARQIRRFGVQIVEFNALECRPSNSMIWSADRPIQRFGVPTMIFIFIVIIIIVSISQPATIAYSRLVASCHDSTFRCCNVQML